MNNKKTAPVPKNKQSILAYYRKYGWKAGVRDVLHDLIDYYERISVHCSSIAVALIELDLEALGVRNYTVSLRQRRDAIFKDRVEEYRNKYNFDDIDDVVACVKRPGERKEALLFTSHGIRPDAKLIHMKTEWLEKILAAAKEADVAVLAFDEIPVY